ncbi:MAG TPA: hypothetical protein VMK13_04275, partial [Streptosporangiaceae bacterium]|nr:hypothetical protein [Streptosporangiaceae bacterium]
MPAPAIGTAERTPRRSGPLAPGNRHRRGDFAVAAALAAILAQLLFAQLTLVLAVVLLATDRLTRWRPQWLAVPAAAGLIWALAIGSGRAAAGPSQVAAHLAAAIGHPAALMHLSRGFGGSRRWLPRQFPLALIAAAGEAAAVSLAGRLRRLRAGEPVTYRPGLVIAARRRAARAALAAGGVVTSDGACLGLDPATGQRAAISWREAERGVLVTGPDAAALAESGAALAQAAIRRRKAVIVIDLTGSQAIAASLTAACAAAAAPLRRFGAAGQRCYEPARGGNPARTAALTIAMIDWSAVSDARRRTCAAYLSDACAVRAAAPADPRLPVLDDLAGLLQPDALRARAALVPGCHPRREALAGRADVSARILAADPAAARAAAEQLSRLRGSALGRWLRPAAAPGPPGQGAPAAAIGLADAMRDRAVVTFALDRAVHGRSAAMVAALAAADLLAILAELQAMAVRTDCLAWISGCEMLPRGRLADLVRRGAQAGAAVLLTTASATAAAALADDVGVIVTRGRADPALEQRLAELADPAVR